MNPPWGGNATALPVVTSCITHGLNLVLGEPSVTRPYLVLPDVLWATYRMVFGLPAGTDSYPLPFFFDETGCWTSKPCAPRSPACPPLKRRSSS